MSAADTLSAERGRDTAESCGDGDGAAWYRREAHRLVRITDRTQARALPRRRAGDGEPHYRRGDRPIPPRGGHLAELERAVARAGCQLRLVPVEGEDAIDRVMRGGATRRKVAPGPTRPGRNMNGPAMGTRAPARRSPKPAPSSSQDQGAPPGNSPRRSLDELRPAAARVARRNGVSADVAPTTPSVAEQLSRPPPGPTYPSQRDCSSDCRPSAAVAPELTRRRVADVIGDSCFASSRCLRVARRPAVASGSDCAAHCG
jgi:hypothetical protein